METNPNPILHFNERPGASPDYRFDYVETDINLGVLAARREEQGIYKNWNCFYSTSPTSGSTLFDPIVSDESEYFTKIQIKRSIKVVDVFNLIGGFLDWFTMLQSWQTKARKSEEKWGKAEFMLFIVWVFLRQLRRSVGNGAHYLKWRYQHFSAVLFQVE